MKELAEISDNAGFKVSGTIWLARYNTLDGLADLANYSCGLASVGYSGASYVLERDAQLQHQVQVNVVLRDLGHVGGTCY